MELIGDKERTVGMVLSRTTSMNVVVSMLAVGLILLAGGAAGSTVAIQRRMIVPPALNIHLNRLHLVSQTTKLPDYIVAHSIDSNAFPSHMPDYYTIWMLLSDSQLDRQKGRLILKLLLASPTRPAGPSAIAVSSLQRAPSSLPVDANSTTDAPQ